MRSLWFWAPVLLLWYVEVHVTASDPDPDAPFHGNITSPIGVYTHCPLVGGEPFHFRIWGNTDVCELDTVVSGMVVAPNEPIYFIFWLPGFMFGMVTTGGNYSSVTDLGFRPIPDGTNMTVNLIPNKNDTLIRNRALVRTSYCINPEPSQTIPSHIAPYVWKPVDHQYPCILTMTPTFNTTGLFIQSFTETDKFIPIYIVPRGSSVDSSSTGSSGSGSASNTLSGSGSSNSPGSTTSSSSFSGGGLAGSNHGMTLIPPPLVTVLILIMSVIAAASSFM